MSFQEGGAAGFGKGGPYGGWGYGWHTIIYSDGGLYTDRLYASAGTFTGTVNANAGTFNNVTINSNCDVKGTIYADKIMGDVMAVKLGAFNTTYTIPAASKPRKVIVLPFTAKDFGTSSSAALAFGRLKRNGVQVDYFSKQENFSSGNSGYAYATDGLQCSLSANTAYTIMVESSGCDSDFAPMILLLPESTGSIY